VVVAGDVAAGGAAAGLAGGHRGPLALQPAQRAGGGQLPTSGQLKLLTHPLYCELMIPLQYIH
jgi:hypothetical protein